jgi:hypothetical protein
MTYVESSRQIQIAVAPLINGPARRFMRFIKLVLAALSITTLLCGCEAAAPSPMSAKADERSSKAPSNTVQWVESYDGMLALRLAVASQAVADGDAIKVTAQIRNTGQTPITVLRPFGDWYFAAAVGLKIWTDKRRIRYSGDTPGYEIGASAFAVVAPGAVIEDHIELTTHHFAGIEAKGTYHLRYDYSYDGRWDATAAVDGSDVSGVWRGTICSREVPVTRE